jgi:hypothetical protein
VPQKSGLIGRVAFGGSGLIRGGATLYYLIRG